MNGSQICVLEQGDEVSLAGLLQSHHRRALEAQVGLKVLRDLTNQALEWEFADKELGRLLIPPDFTESNSSWTEAMRLLDTSSSLEKGKVSMMSCMVGNEWTYWSGLR